MLALARSALLVAALALAACGGDDVADIAPAPEADAPTEVAASMTPPDAPPPFDGPVLDITMTPVGNTMVFEQTELTAQPGQTIRLTFDNTADDPAMSHNVVFLHSGTNVDAFGQAAMMADQTEFIPVELADWVIAHTPLAAPGETVSVEFTAPAAGTYVYLCSFPGHYMLMQGTLTVAASA